MCKEITCVACPRGCQVKVIMEGGKIAEITGFSCPQGEEYAKEEVLSPARILPTTVLARKGVLPVLPVRTTGPIPREKLGEAMEATAGITVTAPVEIGEVVYHNLLGLGVDLVATRNLTEKKD